MSNTDVEPTARRRKGMAADSAGDGRRAYHLSPARLCLVPAVWLAVAGPLLWLAAGEDTSTDEAYAFGITAALYTLMMFAGQAIVWQSRLVLTPAGVAHHQLGYTIRSRWDNVRALSVAAGAQGLWLRRPGTDSRLLYWSTRLIAAPMPHTAAGLFVDADLLATGQLILLTPFMAHWRRGALRADLLRWAPHLFDAAGQPLTPAAEGAST